MSVFKKLLCNIVIIDSLLSNPVASHFYKQITCTVRTFASACMHCFDTAHVLTFTSIKLRRLTVYLGIFVFQ